MVPRRDGPHPNEVEAPGDEDRLKRDARPNGGEAGDMNKKEWNRGRIHDVIVMIIVAVAMAAHAQKVCSYVEILRARDVLPTL